VGSLLQTSLICCDTPGDGVGMVDRGLVRGTEVDLAECCVLISQTVGSLLRSVLFEPNRNSNIKCESPLDM